MNRSAKVKVVSNISNAMSGVSYIYVCERFAMTVAELERMSLDAACSNVFVKSIKNSIAKIALKSFGLDDWLSKSSVFIYGGGDPILAASIINKYSAMYKGRFIVNGVVLDGVSYQADAVNRLAKFVSVDGLKASALSLVKSPLAKMARVLKLVAEKKGE